MGDVERLAADDRMAGTTLSAAPDLAMWELGETAGHFLVGQAIQIG